MNFPAHTPTKVWKQNNKVASRVFTLRTLFVSLCQNRSCCLIWGVSYYVSLSIYSLKKNVRKKENNNNNLKPLVLDGLTTIKSFNTLVVVGRIARSLGLQGAGRGWSGGGGLEGGVKVDGAAELGGADARARGRVGRGG